jgi:hypothetical protein
MNRQESARLVAIVMGAYPSQAAKMSAKQGEAMITAYETLLDDVTYELAQGAVRVLAQTEKFMPSVAEIRAACLELTNGPKRPGGDAWGDVIALRTFRDVTDMAKADPITLHICKEFGWIEYRTLFRNGADVDQWHVVSGDNEAADRARFIELYDKLKAQGHRETVAPLLATARATRERELPGNPFQRALTAATTPPEKP